MKLALDAGHGFNTAGKRTPDDIREWTLNNRVVTEMQRLFKGYNIDVKRIDDPTGANDISLNERDRLMSGCDVLLSVHHNAFQSKWGEHTGTETLVQTNSNANMNYAKKMNEAVVKAIGLRDRGVKVQNTQILRNFKGKAGCLVEVGFMDSTIDNPIITNVANSKKVAQALVSAFVAYWDVKKKVAPITPKPTPPVTPPSNGINWASQNGEFKMNINVWERDYPSLDNHAGKKLISKTTVYYNAYVHLNGYTWLRLVDYYGVPTGKVMPWREIDGDKYGVCKFRNVPDKPSNEIQVGSKVKIKSGSKYQGAHKGAAVPNNIIGKVYTVDKIDKGNARLKEITSWVAIVDLTKVN